MLWFLVLFNLADLTEDHHSMYVGPRTRSGTGVVEIRRSAEMKMTS